ncbi:protein SIX6OS1 [Anoplopoma fimbria]|uniref:protein SIX6OS1 n=1 Tax=Anoplopoma fimbria TaxID=229290 RepID=UPI0023ED49F2|nr:protein SIX6OS1 [Anoplopoma fimbria]
MDDQHSLKNIDSLLFQSALQTRELSQKKNEINQQIRVCRVDTAEKKSYIETIHRNIRKLEEEISVKQSTVIHNKANAKSMKTTNSLLLQYEQTLKAELESKKASYNHDMEVYDERIASCRKIFQSHKEHYYQNTLAQKLLTLQAEKEEIEFRIKACEDQITMKQKELDQLTGPAVDSSSTEKLPDNVTGQQPIAEPEEQLDPQTEEESSSSIDISSLHLNQTKNGHKTSVEANTEEMCEENEVQYTTSPSSGEENNELWSCQPPDEQREPDEMHTDEQEQETGQEDQVLQFIASAVEQSVEVEVEKKVAIDEDKAQSEVVNEGLAAFPQSSSPDKTLQSTPVEMTAVPSTPTFPFNFSPASSPPQGTSDTISPAFLFSLNPEPSVPGFSGFGFDSGSSQDEESPFAFTSSFFNEKKTTEPKSSTCPEFLFGQPEQSEAFQFPFTSKSPQTTNNENTRDDFPFSFSF